MNLMKKSISNLETKGIKNTQKVKGGENNSGPILVAAILRRAH
jgi:hypothetical protein